jgi:hypothetical protein
MGVCCGTSSADSSSEGNAGGKRTIDSVFGRKAGLAEQRRQEAKRECDEALQRVQKIVDSGEQYTDEEW